MKHKAKKGKTKQQSQKPERHKRFTSVCEIRNTSNYKENVPHRTCSCHSLLWITKLVNLCLFWYNIDQLVVWNWICAVNYILRCVNLSVYTWNCIEAINYFYFVENAIIFWVTFRDLTDLTNIYTHVYNCLFLNNSFKNY